MTDELNIHIAFITWWNETHDWDWHGIDTYEARCKRWWVAGYMAAQARTDMLTSALTRIAKASEFDDIHNQTEVWELVDIAKEAIA